MLECDKMQNAFKSSREDCVADLGSDEFRWFMVPKQKVSFSNGKLRCLLCVMRAVMVAHLAVNKWCSLICHFIFLPVLPL